MRGASDTVIRGNQVTQTDNIRLQVFRRFYNPLTRLE